MNKNPFNKIEDVVLRNNPGHTKSTPLLASLLKSAFRGTCANVCFNIALPVKVACA